MSKTRSKLYSACETAYVLRRLLWPRQWRDFLSDCVRGKGGLGGWLLLEPYAADEQHHPLYHPADIVAFVKSARAMKPSWELSNNVETQWRVHDDTIGLPWRMRTATRAT